MRKIYSLRNFLTSAVPFVIIGILGFFRVKVYLSGFGEEISSLNYLFNSLIAYLALSEGGVGLFVLQKYFKLFAEKDYDKINELYTLSKKLFKFIGIFIISAGIIISFGLAFFTNNNISLSYMQLAFIIFLIKNSIDYFMYAPRFIIQGDQKQYKINYLISLIRIIEIIVEILLIKIGVNYLIVLIPGIFIRLIIFNIINQKIKKEYPWLKIINRVDFKEIKGVRHIVSQKISGLIYDNTDVLLVSSFLKPFYVIIYSSYNFIVKYLNDFVYLFYSASQSSLGNVLYTENGENSYNIFMELFIFFSFIGTLFCSLFISLINPFINLWIGEKYIASQLTLYLFAILLFISICQKPINMLKDNLGLFKETKKVILVEALLNFFISLLLISKYKICGVIIGTVIATTLTTFWYLPKYCLNRHYKHSCAEYFKIYFLCITSALAIPKIIDLIVKINVSNFALWTIKASIIGIVYIFTYLILFYVSFTSFRRLSNKLFLFIKLKGNEK